MSELIITPNLDKKTARIRGKLAAGEHVEVILKDCANLPTDNLRFRVLNRKETIALFPIDDEDLYTVIGNDLIFTLNLNTINAITAIKHFGERAFLFVLDDASEDVRKLYFSEFYEISKWCLSEGQDIPISLDTYQDDIKEIRNDFENINDSIDGLDNRVENVNTSLSVVQSGLSTLSTNLSTTNVSLQNHINDKSNPHQVTKAQLALGNVDNTCDLDKPVSYPQQQALNELSANIAIVDSELESTREELEDEILGKADVNHTHSQYALASNVANNISALSNAIQGKADVLHTHSGYAATNHTHSDLATKYELNTELAKKANVNHTHNYSPIGHGHADYVKQSDIAEFIAASNPQPLKDRNFSLATVRDISSALAEVIRALGGNVL